MTLPLSRFRKIQGDGSIPQSRLDLETWNGVIDELGSLLAGLIKKGADFDAVAATATGVLLERINGVLGPAYDEVDALQTELEERLAALSASGAVAKLDGSTPFVGKVPFAAPTAARASANFPAGTEPTSPIPGDFWPTASGAAFRLPSGVSGSFAFTNVALLWSERQTFEDRINLPARVTDETEEDGDFWSTSAGFVGRWGGVTRTLASTAAATTATPGLIRLATPEEVAAGTATTRAVTPAGLASQAAATTTSRGTIELATFDEVVAGLDGERAVTPETLARVAVRYGDVRLLALRLAELAGDRISMADGIADPLTDETDVDAASKSGITYSGAYYPVGEKSGTVPTTGSTAIASSSELPAAQAFDGNNATVWRCATAAGATSGVGWIGYNFGTPVRIGGGTIRNAATAGLAPGTVALQGSNDGAAWTTVHTFGVSSSASGITTFTVSNIETVGAPAYSRWRFLAQGNPANGKWEVAEITFAGVAFPLATVASVAFASDVANPATARLALQYSPARMANYAGEPPVINTELVGSVSRDGGTTYTAVPLTLVEILSDGTALYDGTVSIAGQPAGAAMKWKATMQNKPLGLSGAVFQWK